MHRGLHFSLRAAIVGARVSRVALATSLAVAAPALADETVATLQGRVDGVPAGTEVAAIDTQTGHRMTARVDAKGNYVLLGVRPSRYRVEVAGRGAQEATLLVGQTVVVDFSSTADQIVVTGKRARTQQVTQELSTNVTTAQIENLPQNSRNFLSFASLAPGVSLASPSGATQIQAGAVSPDQSNIYIDGISFKNLTNHGGAFGQNFGQGGNPFPQIAIQEYNIETQNFGAEVSGAGSAVITAITKSGGNSFHGDAFIDFQPNDFIQQPFFDAQNKVPKPSYNRYQFGGDIGGPIIKDKLAFYFGAEGVSESLPGATGLLNPTQPGHTVGYPANVVTAVQGVARVLNFHQGLYLGKLTYYATPQDTINLEAYVRRETNLADVDAKAALTHARSLQTQVTQYQLNWKHAAGNLLNILNLAYNTSGQSTPTIGSGPEYNLTNGIDFNSAAFLGANFFTQADHQKSYTIKDDATLRVGDHKIKFGGQVIYNELSRSVSNAFNGRYYYLNPGASVANFDPLTAIPYGADINLLPINSYNAKDTQIGFYAQDEWKYGTHWTFNLGIRWDLETNANNNDYVTPASIVTALQNYPNLAAAGINYKDYVSNGHSRKPRYDQFQPRVGFSYDVNGDRDLIIFGGAGRYYDRSLFIEGAIETLTNGSTIPRVTFAAPGTTCPTGSTTCLPFSPSLLNATNLRSAIQSQLTLNGGDAWLLNNNTPAPFSDEFDIGVRKRLGVLQTSLSLSYVRSHNQFQFVRGNRFPDGSYSPIGLGVIQDNFPVSGRLPGFSGRLDLGQSRGTADLVALYLKVEKPFTDVTNWGFITAFTVQRARTNDATPSIFNQDEFFNGGSQTAYGSGNVAGVPQWIWNTSANARLPYGFQLSGTLNLNSGPAFGSVIFGTDRNGTPLPPGTIYANFNGLYYPKGLVGFKRLDLRIQKTFKMPYAQSHELTLSFEGFNIFNWVNRNYNAWGAGAGRNPTLVEDSQIANDQRQFQAGLKYKF